MNYQKKPSKKTDNTNLYMIGLTIFSSILSVVAWYMSYFSGVGTAYNDAMSHLNLARMVFDNLHPGFTQIGGVWLPLNHMLYIPLIWNNWAWHSGFAGSIFSMLSYIFSVLLIFKIVYVILKEKFPSLVAALVFALNINILYLQSTALTEPLFIFIFILSLYCFIRWMMERNYKYFIFFALSGFFLVLSRYDGWFVVIIELLLVICNEIWYQKKKRVDTLGIFIIAALPAFYGIALWLLWNKLIFGDPLFFAIGPYSAHAQQITLSHKTGLITKGNIWVSVMAYYYAIADNIGIFPLIIGSICAVYFFIWNNSLSIIKKSLIFLFLFSPLLFNILSLYFGFSVLNVPELHWNPTNDPVGKWFNVRYGILALPLFAVFTGLGIKSKKIGGIIIILCILFQAFIFFF